MEDYKKELLFRLVKRYNYLRARAFNSDDDEYRAGLELRANEVRFLVEDLFGENSVTVRTKLLACMSVSED